MPNLRTRHRRFGAGVAIATAIVFCLLPESLAAAAPSSSSSPGSWGAGAYRYLEGLVCSSLAGTPAEITTPLASWYLGGPGAPAYLTEPVTSVAGVDSAAPPLPSVGPQAVHTVVAGEPGFASESDIATYASLISRFGSDGGAEQSAEVAHAVLAAVSGDQSVGGEVPPPCDNTGAEAALLRQARELAGPYTVTVTGGSSPVQPGTAQTVTATVRSAAGKPVPDAPVDFTAPDAALSAHTAMTGPDGSAAVQLTVPLGTDRPAVHVRASTALPVGLDEVTATTNPSATDPTGAVAPALLAAAPVEVSAAGKVRVDRSADPVLHVRARPGALVVGAPSTPRVRVSGMYGHRATVQVVVSGPVPLSRHTLCGNLDGKDFARTAATTYTLQTTGDVTAAAGQWTPHQPGCYQVTAALTTLDAVPQAHADAVSTKAVTVLDTTATATPALPLVSPGDDSTGRVLLAHGYGLAGTAHVRLLGPVRPRIGAHQCAGVDFADAPAGPATTVDLAEDMSRPAAHYSLHTSSVGCYRVAGTAVLRLPDGGAVHVPIGEDAAHPVLAIAPRITYSMTRIWAYQHGAVSARATVIGTFDAPAHVALRLQRVSDSPLGCRSAHFTGATPSHTGPAVPVDGDLQTVSVSSGRLAATGCYAPVAVLTMDANPSITATGHFVALRSAVEVGLDPRDLQQAATIDARVRSAPTPTRWWIGLAFLALAGAAVGFAWITARRERAPSGRPTG
ncbi:MAG TPA: Ig-like domain-containing protein [Jatrophihabitans sp.]|nr:Ig-like domain-containing protein [Jatrophihabitans sp.]